VSTDRKEQVSSLDARDDLTWVADRWHFLVGKLTPGGGNAQGVRVSSCPEPALPIDLNVSDLMREVEDNARFWAQVLMDDTTWAPTTSAMPTLLNEVAARHGHFTENDRISLEFSDAAHDLREKVRKILDPVSAPTYLGPCQAAECIGEIYVSAGKDSGRCRVCDEPFTAFTQRAWLAGELDTVLKTQAEIIRSLKILDLGVADSTVWSWVRRGQLVPVEDGLYSLADAIALTSKRSKIAA